MAASNRGVTLIGAGPGRRGNSPHCRGVDSDCRCCGLLIKVNPACRIADHQRHAPTGPRPRAKLFASATMSWKLDVTSWWCVCAVSVARRPPELQARAYIAQRHIPQIEIGAAPGGAAGRGLADRPARSGHSRHLSETRRARVSSQVTTAAWRVERFPARIRYSGLIARPGTRDRDITQM